MARDRPADAAVAHDDRDAAGGNAVCARASRRTDLRFFDQGRREHQRGPRRSAADPEVAGRARGPCPLARDPACQLRLARKLRASLLLRLSVPQVTDHADGAERSGQLLDITSGTRWAASAPPSSRARSRRCNAAGRLVGGSLLRAAGLVAAGFGVSGLLTAGHCSDPSQDPKSCSPYSDTTRPGGASVGLGAAALVGGMVMIAIPDRAHTPSGQYDPLRA